MSGSRRPGALTVLIAVIVMLGVSAILAFAGLASSSALMPGSSMNDGQIGLALAMIPILWLWKKFLAWCGVTFR